MNFQDAGRTIDKEIASLMKYLDQKVKPKTKNETAAFLRKTSERLSKLAQSLEEKA